MKKSGFTLIELLIVITIIAILTLAGLVAYSNFLKNSRDVKRQADLKLIQSALEDCRADTLSYPATGSVTSGSALTCSGRTYLNSVPSDPRSGSYSYTQTGAGTDYTLCATMEKLTPLNYCVSRP